MTDYKDINLYQKIQKVSDEIKNIEKNTTVGTGSNAYKAVADIDVLLKVKQSETKYGLISIPVKQELVRTDQVMKQSRDGYQTVTFADIVKMTVRIINIDNPSETIEVESFGRGLDSGDKGFGKASTYARKYALLNAYKIATGEDPDEQASVDIPVNNTDQLRTMVLNYMAQDANYASQACQYFGVATIDELNTESIKKLYDSLHKKNIL